MAKKITRVEGGETTSASTAKETKSFVASDESKAKARTFRIIAIISWIVAIGFEVWCNSSAQKSTGQYYFAHCPDCSRFDFCRYWLSAVEKVKQT